MLCMMPAVAFCIRSAYHSSCSGTQSASKESNDASDGSACSSAAPPTAAAAAATSCMMDVGVRHGGVRYQGYVGSGESVHSRARE